MHNLTKFCNQERQFLASPWISLVRGTNYVHTEIAGTYVVSQGLVTWLAIVFSSKFGNHVCIF